MDKPTQLPLPQLASCISEPCNESPEGKYAFLVHSQDSLGCQSSPNIDDQRLARQRRKRTSPKDQVTLEAEYNRDPRPDKATRLEIVTRVALGEKEVQIWFQNRRQLTRRKSRPTDISEFQSNGRLTQEDAATEYNSSQSVTTSDQQISPSSQSSILSIQTQEGPEQCPKADHQAVGLSREDLDETKSPSNEETQSEGLCQTFKMDSTGSLRPRQPADMFKASSPARRRPGYLANRRNASFVIQADVEDCESKSTSSQSQPGDDARKEDLVKRTVQPLRRTASMVKLSMDSEGKAEITARTGDTPSPPKPQKSDLRNATAMRRSGLHRSFSAIEPGSRSGVPSKTTGTAARRHSIGRSRDARTWEFYCDSSAREALIQQAEREESGSATAAIGLLRSRSSNQKLLASNPNKRNAHAQKHDSAKRHKPDIDNPARSKLERTTSSVARLQTTSGNHPVPRLSKTGSKPGKGSETSIFEDPDCDSDKENWQPGTRRRAQPRPRPVNSQRSSRVLLESLREPSETSKLGVMLGQGTSKRQSNASKSIDKENLGPKIDDEVAAFMGETDLPREEEDLDCVQNLLSLSQAAWV